MKQSIITEGQSELNMRNFPTSEWACCSHRVKSGPWSWAASYFSFHCILRPNFFLLPTLLLILRIHLHKRQYIDITTKRVSFRVFSCHLWWVVTKILLLQLHTFCVTSCFIHALPRRHPAPNVHRVSPICVNMSDAAYLLLCVMCERATPYHPS